MKTKRKKYLINPAYQLSVIRQLGIVTLLGTISICVLFYLHQLKVGQIMAASGLPPTATSINLALLNDRLFIEMGIMIAAMVGLFVFIGIRTTHRIAGPMYKLDNYLRDYLSGKPVGRLAFRQKDEFKTTLELINKVIEGQGKSKIS